MICSDLSLVLPAEREVTSLVARALISSSETQNNMFSGLISVCIMLHSLWR